MTEPEIDTAKVAFIIEKARTFEVPETVPEDEEDIAEPEPPAIGASLSAATDFDDMAGRRIKDPAFDEARSRINDMNIDEQCQLVALAWIGRGDYEPDEWQDVVNLARQEHTNRTAEYLFGMPHLPDHLQAGLEAFDLSI